MLVASTWLHSDNWRTWAKILVPAALFLTPVSVMGVEQPDAIVRSVTDVILRSLRSNMQTYQDDEKQLYTMVNRHVGPHIDFDKISQLILDDSTWREATVTQRAGFKDSFREVLLRAYSVVLLDYSDQTISYLSQTHDPGDRSVEVKAEIKKAGELAAKIKYSFYRDPDGWKIYNIVANGNNLVKTYRRQYLRVAKTDGMDVLIARMNELATPSGSGD